MMNLGPYQVHWIADLFPLLPDDELAALAEDIKFQGQQEPITVTADEQVLVDGRNRYLACERLNIEPLVSTLPEYYTEQHIRDYIISANVRRRHLDRGQLAIVAAQLATATQGSHKKSSSSLLTTTVAEAARMTGAAESTIKQAKAVLRDAGDLAEKVMAGEMSLTPAYEEMQQRMLAKEPRPQRKPSRKQVFIELESLSGPVNYPKPQGKSTFNETPGEGISWAAWSWNPVTGCLHGCEYCYAREIATSKRLASAYPIKFEPLFHSERLSAPVNTVIPAKYRDDSHEFCGDGDCQICAYRRVFVCSMADLYGRWVPKEWIQQVHDVMLKSPQWQYITLTKFPDRYKGLELPPNAWIGASVDEQKRVRIAERAFSALPEGVIKWLSLEPLREPLRFNDLSMFDWVVIGAQTETRQPTGVVEAFRPPFEWVMDIVTQAREAGCQIHMKPNLLQHPGMQLLNEYPGGKNVQ